MQHETYGHRMLGVEFALNFMSLDASFFSVIYL